MRALFCHVTTLFQTSAILIITRIVLIFILQKYINLSWQRGRHDINKDNSASKTVLLRHDDKIEHFNAGRIHLLASDICLKNR